MSNKQIYSATYSNVPVFEYVTPEGPIMRRKSDSWINATHILKIAKFPKAKRTRILEKDVQTGIHEKVQGGYGKYQGTYVPLDLGAEIARSFDVYDILKPIFEFKYIEGKTATPPPAPKHNHASASNVAARANSDLQLAKKSKSSNSLLEPPRKRGRPKRVALNQAPTLKHNDTTPIATDIQESRKATRQDTEQDALNIMANNLNHGQNNSQRNAQYHPNVKGVKDKDLEAVDMSSDDMDDDNIDDDEFLTGRELFGTPKTSFIGNQHAGQLYNRPHFPGTPHAQGMPPNLLGVSTRNNSYDPYGLSQYHHPHQNNLLRSFKDELVYSEYFTNLLNFFLEDNSQSQSSASPVPETSNGSISSPKNETNGKPMERKSKDTVIPKHLLNPPQPISRININQAIDNDGNTIFHWACSMANFTIIEFLMTNFPSIINSNIKNHNGETPLMFLIKFSNSYQLKNFPNLLDSLFDSVLLVDNYNKTVLHHIALSVATPNGPDASFNGNDESQFNNYLKNKERIARYYIECLFTKIIEFQEYSNNNGTTNDLIRKFINHQDSDGNTAFHLIAYNLNKKLIRVFISYHRFIDFGIKNLVNYSVEEYLASHNYILKLENDSDDATKGYKVTDLIDNKSSNIESFESQLYYSKMTVNLTNSASNLITEKLTELQFLIDKELNEKDEKLLKLININSKFQHLKTAEQTLILKLFKLDYLVKDIDNDLHQLDLKRDKIIQDEINRFVNDLTFQVLQKKEKLTKKIGLYKSVYLKKLQAKLKQTESKKSEIDLPDDKFQLAVLLQKEMIKSNKLTKQMFGLEPKVPILNKDEFKENSSEITTSTISNYPADDKLNKYCKLISLCCEMNVDEVESSIDSIELSLFKSLQQK